MTGAERDQRAHLEAVSETLFLTLYALAAESRSERPIIVDEALVRLTEELNRTFRDSDVPFFRRLATRRLPRLLVTTVALRIRHFDGLVRVFLDRDPAAVVVNLGCGLDNRRNRLDNGRMRWYDLDLPDVIALRRRFFPETGRLSFLPSSVLDFDWLDRIEVESGRRALFLAEGLFMYLPKDGVRSLVARLRERFPGSELAAEVAHRKIVRISRSLMGRGKFRRQFGLSGDVFYQCGLSDSAEIETWAPGIKLLDEWTYFDEPEPKLRWIRPLSWWKLFRYAQWTAHYRLGEGIAS